ncbi:MAG: DUF1080 domain-containing protein [Pirellulales bacterium]|nr:DUF1080 domain-containing protein [Pirellulales bacterium]
MTRGIAICCILSVAPVAVAAERVRPITDPAQAGPDFAVQGEYAGQLDDGRKLGVQVVALGGAKFDARVFNGGLPGAGAELPAYFGAHGETVDGTTTFVNQAATFKICDGRLEWFESGLNSLGTLSRVERQSPTLGQAPPAGALVLFNGTDAAQFKSGRMLPNQTMPAGSVTRPLMGDGTLHIEFRTPFMPQSRGQDRGNSGVYLQARYEVQVLDSFGLLGLDNECGGLYGFSAPKVNMCLPPLTWQTFDIDFTGPRFDVAGQKTANARITVRHNGVVVQDGVELPHESGLGQKESPEPGPLQLQFHMCPVQFRNIWWLEKTAP